MLRSCWWCKEANNHTYCYVHIIGFRLEDELHCRPWSCSLSEEVPLELISSGVQVVCVLEIIMCPPG